jgi:hypothetical protein
MAMAVTGRSATSGLLAEDRGHAEPTVLDRRSLAEHLVTVDTGGDDVRAQHVDERQGMRGRRDVVEIEGGDIIGMIEHRTELLGVAIEFGVGEEESGEVGDLGNIVTSEAFGHGGSW